MVLVLEESVVLDMNKVRSWLNKHRYIKAMLVITFCSTIFVVGMNIYEKYFNYEKVPYCENGYELKNGRCTKQLTRELIGYECEDNENYEKHIDNEAWCVLKKEFMVEPKVTEKCRDGFEEEIRFNEYIGKNELRCWGQTGRGTGGIKPEKIYTCPEGYSIKDVYYDSQNSSQTMCILDKYASSDYKAGVPAKEICPSGYEYERIKRTYPNGGHWTSDGYKSDIVTEYEDRCVRNEVIEPKYKKVYN